MGDELLKKLSEMLDDRFGKFEAKLDAKFDAKFEAIDKRITSVETRLTYRIDKLENKFDQKFVKLENRFIRLEGQVSTLTIRFNTLTNRFNDFERNHSYYKKQESDIQEGYLTDKLYQYLNETMPTKYIQKLPLQKVYRQDGSEITELDGCLLIKARDNIINNNKTRRHRYLRIPPQLVILEAKRTPDKMKVDIKLEQVYELLSTNKAYNNKASNNISSFAKNLNEQSIYDDIILIIGSDYIPESIDSYINYINNFNNTTRNETSDEHDVRKREEYTELCIKMANEDPVFFDIKKVLNYNKHAQIVDLDDEIYSIEYNQTSKLFRYNSTIQHWKSHTYDYMKPYFEIMGKHIGLITNTETEFPEQVVEYNINTVKKMMSAPVNNTSL